MLSTDNRALKFALCSYELLAKVGNCSGILLLLFFRVNWGLQFFITGQGKLLHHADIVSFFASLNLPLPDMTAWFVAGVECIGGILLLLGLATRPVGLVLTGNMIVAYLSVADDRATVLHFFDKQDPFLHADPFFFLLAALLAFCFGGGPISLDALLGKWFKKKLPLDTQAGITGKS